MRPCLHLARLHLELLEGGDVSANLTVTFAAGTSTVVGDAGNNDVSAHGGGIQFLP